MLINLNKTNNMRILLFLTTICISIFGINKTYNNYSYENYQDVSLINKKETRSTNINYDDYSSFIENNHFKIIYNSNYNSDVQASQLLTIFEKARSAALNLSFKENFANEHNLKLLIELYPFDSTDEDGNKTNTIASTIPLNSYNNKIWSKILFYKFEDITQSIKETVFHEYFHTIQQNYNSFYLSNETTWFVESTANWAKIKFNEDTSYVHSWLLNYVSQDCNKSLYTLNGYSTFLFPLLLEQTFDENIIRKIYEYLDNLTINQTFSSLKQIINNVIAKEYNSTETFDDIFSRMSSYLISINHNFYNYSINYDDLTFDIFNNFYTLSPTSSTSYEIYPYSSDYYKINLPSDVNYHDINIKINTNSDIFLYNYT